MDFKQWEGFEKGEWTKEIDVRNFIQKIIHLTQEMKNSQLLQLKKL